jgi:hypothetical protein
MRKGVFKFFKKQPKIKENLPELIKNARKNELSSKVINIEEVEKAQQDPLMMRINIEKYDYYQENLKDRALHKKLWYNIRSLFLRFSFTHRFFRNEKVLLRPHPNQREPHFDIIPESWRFSNAFKATVILVFAFFTGYFWAKLRYDIYTRRYLYTHLFSIIMAFEYCDYQATQFLNLIEKYFPSSFSDKEAEFIIYRKFRNFFVKRRLEKKVDEIINDKNQELLEIDEKLKK